MENSIIIKKQDELFPLMQKVCNVVFIKNSKYDYFRINKNFLFCTNGYTALKYIFFNEILPLPENTYKIIKHNTKEIHVIINDKPFLKDVEFLYKNTQYFGKINTKYSLSKEHDNCFHFVTSNIIFNYTKIHISPLFINHFLQFTEYDSFDMYKNSSRHINFVAGNVIVSIMPIERIKEYECDFNFNLNQEVIGDE